jgi:hypothetical protein
MNMKQLLLVSILLCCIVASAHAQEVPPELVAAVNKYASSGGDTEQPAFEYGLTDLDGDGRADAVVLLLGSNWCGSGGCNMLVFHGTTEGFKLVSESTVTNDPIRVSPKIVKGWHTLIVMSNGKGDVLMRFNGKRYPANPSMQPLATAEQVRNAQELKLQKRIP